ncbi:MAG: DUF3006 domain-containing protein [Patescibacteria group bacterium]|jgi:hypothetical protein
MIIKLTVDRFEGDKAVLITSDGSKIVWPKNKLSADVHEGATLSFDIVEAAEREKRDKQTAKDIINEIIQNS